MRILVTGSGGFVGGALCRRLAADGVSMRRARRNPSPSGAAAGLPGDEVAVGEIGPETDWAAAVAGIDTVVHLAARVHVMRDTSADPLTEFRRVNTAGTVQLGRSCLAAGVRRLVYVSTIKVLGEATRERPFRAEDPAAPIDPYAVSKWEAEQALRSLASGGRLEVVVVRPPLVYGRGAGGNLRRLMDLLWRRAPLPFASVVNRRSLLGVDNLADLLLRCALAPEAGGELFLAGDGTDLSTPELLRTLGDALGRPARLWPVPPRLLRMAGVLAGASEAVARLCGSLEVDWSRTHRMLRWTPPVPPDAGLRQMAECYAGERARGGRLPTGATA